MAPVSLRARRGEIALLAASVAGFLLVAEGVARVRGLGDPPATGYAPVITPVTAATPINSRGYRDHERRLAKPRGTRRVVCLGDSFAWGSGVRFDDALPQRLERGLNAQRSGTVWEVVNLARPGMNTVDEAPQLVNEGLAYDPDVVVLAYCLNDSEDAQEREARAKAQAERRLARRKEGGPRPPAFLDRFALYRFLHRRLRATAENRRRIQGYKAGYAAAAPGWVAGQEALRDMARRCRDRRVPFVVTIFPLFGNPLDERYPFPEIHAKVAEASNAAGATVVDLLPAYRGLSWELLVVNGALDEHPNEIAHRIAADTLLEALDDKLLGLESP
jgi:lysophospholipase L1-like esterase